MAESKNKASRSRIWNYFEPIDSRITKCLICESEYRNSGNTTNLIDHLKRKHTQQYNEVIQLNNNEIPEAIENIEKEEQEEEEPQNDITETEKDSEYSDIQVVKVKFIFKKYNLFKFVFLQIVPLPHARSEVWNYFGFVANDEGHILDRSKVVCKICASTFCYSGNTTNFYSHLKSMHSEVQMRSVLGKSPRTPKRTYLNMIEDNNNYENNQENSMFEVNNTLTDEEPLPERSTQDIIYIDDITQCLVDFLVTDCRPLCVLQGRGFQRVLKLLAPGYVLPEKQRLTNALRKRYDEMRKENESLPTDAYHNNI